MRRLILAAILLIPEFLGAQALESLIFREKVYDFGDVLEARGNADHEFVFTNNSGRPVKILNVTTSCGCTTPGWSKEPVASGKTGFVKASFDPKGRPGYFNKTLTLLTDADPNPVVLQIKGQVVFSNGDDLYPITMGKLKLKTKSFSMGTAYINKEPVQKQFPVMNDGDEPLRFLGVEKPDYMRIGMPAVIEPHQKGVINVIYDARMKNTFGFVSDNVLFTTSDAGEENKSISVFASLEEFYPTPTAEDMMRAPQAVLREQSVDLGQHTPGVSLERNVMLINKGKRELKIRALQGNCTCISAESAKQSLRAGDSTQIKIRFKPQNRGGTQQKAITVYTNDPRNPVQWLNVLVYIKD